MKRELSRDRQRHLTQEITEAARMMATQCPSGFTTDPLEDLRKAGFNQTLSQTELIFGRGGYPDPAIFAKAYLDGRISDCDLEKAVAESPVFQGMSFTPGNGRHPEVPWKCWSERIDHYYGTSFASEIDTEIRRWLTFHLDRCQSDFATDGFFSMWRRLVAKDPKTIAAFGQRSAEALGTGNSDPMTTVHTALIEIGAASDKTLPELQAQLARTPRWSGLAKWYSSTQLREGVRPALDLANLLAVRLSYESIVANLLAEQPRDRIPDVSGAIWIDSRRNRDFRNLCRLVPDDLGERLQEFGWSELRRIWLAAYERGYISKLLDAFDIASYKDTYRAPPTMTTIGCIPPARKRSVGSTSHSGILSEAAVLSPKERTSVRGSPPSEGSSTFVYRSDEDGGEDRLEAALTGPLVTAQILNWQTYFSPVRSTCDDFEHSTAADIAGEPRLFDSAGAPHALDDYPLSEGTPNEPVRLTCLVDATVESVERVIARHKILGEMVDGEWIVLLARRGRLSRWNVRLPYGSWKPWS